MKLIFGWMVVVLAAFGGGCAAGEGLARVDDGTERGDAIPFELFASFERVEGGNPLIALEPPLWAAATHETELFRGPQYYHILYGGFDGDLWRIGHVRTRDFHTFEPNPHNPIFEPSTDPNAWDSEGVLTGQVIEIGDEYYMLYAGKQGTEWQTGLAKARLSSGSMP